MDGNCFKTRLKRKKSTAEETTSGGTPKKSHAALLPSNKLAKTDGSARPAGAWWNRQQLLAGESLWACTLKAALPYLEEQCWDLLPELPHASAARPVPLWLEEQGWSDLKSEVSPFPEPPHPSPWTSQSPDCVRLTKQDFSPCSSPVRGLLPHSRQSPSHEILKEGSAKREEGRKASLPVNGQLLTSCVKDRAPLQELEQKKEDEVQRCDTKDAGGGLQSCPMCLQVFPAVFTQMDRDGHLAQCLSDMNMDMTW